MNCSGIHVATGENVAIEFDETISEIAVLEETPAEDALWLAPGFVDIQVNGFAGVDFNNPGTPLSDISKALAMILSTGVTRCLPTVITGGPGEMLGCLALLRRAQKELPHARAIAGFHVEGPYIGAEDGPRGAHPLRWVRPPRLDEYRRWQDATDGNVRLITLSPHWPEAPAWIAEVVRDGVTVSIGHTGATAEQIAAAVEAGATLSTHLGNGAHRVMQRHPNYLWEQLAEDRLSASFIVDGIHLGQAFLRTALRAKTVARSVLVTDASAPAGAAPGRYRLGEQDADLTADGRVVLAGTDKLAGSALRMNDGIANLVHLGGLSLRDAVQLATVNPARLIHLQGRMQGLAEGERGDLVQFRFDKGVEILAVYLDGERVV
ncbi:MAG: amidohydrolase family protein [Acidobacteriota bacterium]